MALTILLWNARSIPRKTHELKAYLNTSSPSIVGITETWLNSNLSLHLPGYTVLRKDRQHGRGGGVLLALQELQVYSPLPLPHFPQGHLEIIAVRIATDRGWLSLAVCYNADGTATYQELNHYLSHLPPPVMLMGDFNAHHRCWEPALPLHLTNTSGRALFQLILSSPHLTLLSPSGMPTRYHDHTGDSSVLDLFLGDPSLQPLTVSTGPHMGSDHLPLLASTNKATLKSNPGCLPRWKLTPSGWDKYQAALAESPDLSTLPLNEATTRLTTTLENAGRSAFPLINQRKPSRPGKSWWTDECAQAVKARRQAWNKWRKRPTPQLGAEYRRLKALCTRTILLAQRKSWSSHCASISPTTSIKRTWDFFHSMEGRKTRITLPLSDGTTPIIDNTQKASTLATFYSAKIGCPPSSQLSTPSADLLTASFSLPGTPELSQPFTNRELQRILATLPSGKTPGPDTIPYEFLTHSPPQLTKSILTIFNNSWLTCTFPSKWKSSIILPIPKPGKDPTQPSSYRPIALLSCIGKLLERLVTTRLTWWLESKNLLPPELCGFRPNHSTLDVLTQIEYHICDTYRKREVMTALFIDLEGAFDSAPHDGILYKLTTLGITGPPLAWINSFLTNRKYRVAVGASTSPPSTTLKGVPQGSTLSPLLFNILLSDLRIPAHSRLLVYADDITIISRASTQLEAETHLQEAANALSAWMATWGLNINSSKSEVMCFTRKKTPTPPNIIINGNTVPYVTTHKLLGLWFDGPRLTWSTHIEHLKISCNKRLDVMKRMTGVRWGACRDLLLYYYQTAIRSKLSYGSSLYGSAAPTILKKLEIIQNTALRIAMGAMKSSPISALQAESGLLPLQLHRQELICQHYHHIQTLPSAHPLADIYSTTTIDPEALARSPRARQPLIIRAILANATLNLPRQQPSTIHSQSPVPPWADLSSMFALNIPGLPPKHSAGPVAATMFTQLENTHYHHHLKVYTDGSRSPSPPSTAAAIYIPRSNITQVWRLPHETDIVTAELFAIRQAISHLNTNYAPTKTVIYTDSLSSLLLLLSHHPQSSTAIVHSLQILLLSLKTAGWGITIQWVPSHSNIRGNDIVDAAAKMGLTQENITPLPLPHSTMKKIISTACRTTWDATLRNTLQTTSMGQYRTDSSPHPWVRQTSRTLDVALTRLRLGHTALTAHLHRIGLSPEPYCPWCRNTEETIEHFLLQCPRFHSHRQLLLHQLRALNVTTFDLPTLLAAAPPVPLPNRPTVIRLTCAFLRKSGQLPRL